MMVNQRTLDEAKDTLEHFYGVSVDSIEHVASRLPRLPSPPALLRVDWSRGEETGWQFVEVVGSDIYEAARC